MEVLKGWKTVIFNAGIVALTAGLQELAGVNWVEYVGEVWAMGVVAGINLALRWVTTTPIFHTR